METVQHRPPNASEEFLTRVRGEYCEMPGLCLTAGQAARLWNVEPTLAADALDRLAVTGYLRRGIDGKYALTDSARRTCLWFVDP